MEDTGSDFTMTFRQLSEASKQQLEHGVFPQVLSHVPTPTRLSRCYFSLPARCFALYFDLLRSFFSAGDVGSS